MRRASRKKQLNELSCAYHEAGHAVADVRFEFTCDLVSIIPNREAGTLGRASCLDGNHYDLQLSETGRLEERINNRKARKALVSLLAGYAAEIRYGTKKVIARQGASSDFEKARRILRELGKQTDIRHWIKRADEFVHNDWTAIEMIAQELIETHTLDGTEIETIIAISEGEPGAAEGLARYRVLAGKGPTSQFPFTIVSSQ